MNAPRDLNALSLPELFCELSSTGLVTRALELARDEDLGPLGSPEGDITGMAWGGGNAVVEARLAIRSPGVVAGLALAPQLCQLFAPSCAVRVKCEDGAAVARGATAAVITGPLGELLAMERTLLNFVGRMSGIATLTARYVETMRRLAPGAAARLCDTRKTTPGLRVLEKYAVRCGGGWLHRIGLHDAVLIKDNHIAGITPALTPPLLAARVAEASARARGARPVRFVQVEVDSLEQLAALLELEPGTVEIILLDNMAPPALRDAVTMRDQAGCKTLLEASGGVTLDTIGPIARTGVDRISVGALTHSAPSLDVALDIDVRP